MSCQSSEYNSKLISSWDELQLLRSAWEELWLKSDSYKGWPYFYEIFKLLGKKMLDDKKGHPWCIVVYDRNNNVKGIVPLHFRRKTIGKFKMPVNYIGFMPGRRRNGILSDVEISIIVPHIIQYMNKNPLGGVIDYMCLNDMSYTAIKELSACFAEHSIKYTIVKSNECPLYHEKVIGGMLQIKGNGTYIGDLCSIVIPDKWEDYLNTRHGRFRTHIRSAYKRVSQSAKVNFARYSSEQIQSNEQCLRKIIEWIKQIDNNSWQKQKNVAWPGDYGGYEFFEKYLISVNKKGYLDVSFLMFSDKPVAYIVITIVNGYGNLLFTGYDQDYRDYSPGILLFSEFIKDSIARGKPVELNLTGSKHQYKHQFANKKDSVYELHIYNNTWKGNILYYWRICCKKWHKNLDSFVNS